MLDNVFNNKKFIFLLTFCIEFVIYYYLNSTAIGGSNFSPDLGLAPIFGLMFGPIGALGTASSCFIMDLIEGGDIISSLIDSGIIFLASVLTYKLWYFSLRKKEVSIPDFNSSHSLLKFISIMFVVSNVFWCFLYFVIEYHAGFSSVYAISNHHDIFRYCFNMFSFSLLFGLTFISIFNNFEIPLQYPKRWINLLNIGDKYFLSIYLIVTLAVAIQLIFGVNNHILKDILTITIIILSILFCINRIDIKIKVKQARYTLIRQILLVFLVILAISLFALFDNFRTLIDSFIHNMPQEYSLVVTIFVISILVIFLAILHIKDIEKTITDPIYDLIASLNEYKNQKKELGESILNPQLESCLERDDEISRLVNSFVILKKNILSYLNQIKETTAEKERMETEFNVASEIQSHMIKTDFKEFSKGREFEIFGFMKPAREVGGDFYDYFNIDEDNIGFVIGDVCGKGVPATLLMVKTVYLIRNQSEFDENPEKVMSNVNKLSCERNDEGLFATAFYGKLNLKTGKFLFVNAGHNQPLIKRDKQENNGFEYLDTFPNFILGALETIEYKKQEMNLNPGDTLFLYTDGITEACNKHDEAYGDDRLKEILNKYKDESLKTISEKIKNNVDEFCDGEGQFDDLSMLMIRFTGCENNG